MTPTNPKTGMKETSQSWTRPATLKDTLLRDRVLKQNGLYFVPLQEAENTYKTHACWTHARGTPLLLEHAPSEEDMTQMVKRLIEAIEKMDIIWENGKSPHLNRATQ
jgi:hypothetical protein